MFNVGVILIGIGFLLCVIFGVIDIYSERNEAYESPISFPMHAIGLALMAAGLLMAGVSGDTVRRLVIFLTTS